MQMLRFLRRVFIILILLIIVFFIFRFIKPEATSRFVDKIRGIPTTISSRFHREKKSEIVINGNTTSTSSNFEINENNGDDYEYDNEIYTPVIVDDTDNINEVEDEDNGDVNDMSRLDELNKELDKILASGSNTVENNNELQSGNNIQITEAIGATLPSGFVVVDVEQPYTGNQTNTQTTTTTNTTTNTGSNTSNNTSNSNTTSNNNQSNQQLGSCGVGTNANGEGLSVQDCEQLMRDLGNYN